MLTRRVNSFIINRNNLFYYRRFSRKERVIGFIGLGQMGLPMATNLARKYPVSCHDHQVPLSPLPQGLSMTESLFDLSASSDTIITVLPTAKDVCMVYDELSGFGHRNKVWIDCSTVDPDTSQYVEDKAKQIECNAIDAPMSGGIMAAHQAKLTFLVGGQPEESTLDILKAMGSKVIHCGTQVGSGQKAKICNNMLLGALMVATSESLCLASRLGIDPKLMNQIINDCSGRNWVSECYSPVPGFDSKLPSSNKYKGGFKVSLMSKDLQLALDEVKKRNLKNFEILQTVARQYQALSLHPELQSVDFSINYQFHQDKCTS